jgi:hypothetical protein
MPKITYTRKKFRADTLASIDTANAIIAEYAAQGFSLTLRQLYYQHVARGLIPNNDKEYKKLGDIISDGRLAGLIDWEAIVDRTRALKSLAHWDNPAEIVDVVSRQFAVDKWEGQKYRPEVWIEKDALVGVIEGVCDNNDVAYFSCRGYTSQSEMWVAAQRLRSYVRKGQTPVILHFGDHDPSGRDMSRDIIDRMSLFGVRFNWSNPEDLLTFNRLALNIDQIEEYQPPPNPTKLTDSRATGYIAEFGNESWELDALEPSVLAGLIQDAIISVRDQDDWDLAVEREEEGRALLRKVSTYWENVEETMDDYDPVPETT